MKLSEQKTAINDLWLIAQQQDYYNRVSHSCVRNFSDTYPKQVVKTFVDDYAVKATAPFIKDELVWDGKIFGGNRET